MDPNMPEEEPDFFCRPVPAGCLGAGSGWVPLDRRPPAPGCVVIALSWCRLRRTIFSHPPWINIWHAL